MLKILAAVGAAAPAAGCGDDENTGATGAPDSGGVPDTGADTGMAGDGSSDIGTPDAAPSDAWEDEDPGPLPEYEYAAEPADPSVFSHGVASGDPLPNAVVLWTRITDASPTDALVWWEVARDTEFQERVLVGEEELDPERDFTIKVDAVGLRPGRTYFYRFFYKGQVSRTGRMRTAPEGAVDRLRFAFVSCSNLPDGWFHVYRRLAERPDLDVVLHLGDYIYEYGSDGLRAHEPASEIISLSDYRTRYGQYRRDTDLQAAHQQHPFVVVWDDHESANNSYPDGAQNHSASEGDWQQRKAASIQAWFEWMPVRETADGRIWRNLRYGDLLEFVMLDTRLWGRDEEVGPGDPAVDDEERTLLGADQEAWLAETLRQSNAQWKFLGQQVMMGQLQIGGGILNGDQWDGYGPCRSRLFDVIENDGIDNVVVLTGDIHTSWAMDVCRDPNDPLEYNPSAGVGALAVEFVTPSVTSGALAGVTPAILDILYDSNPHIRWADLSRKGYVVVDVTPERVQGAWFLLDSVEETTFTESFARAYSTQSGVSILVEDAAPAEPPALAPPSAPDLPGRPFDA